MEDEDICHLQAKGRFFPLNRFIQRELDEDLFIRHVFGALEKDKKGERGEKNK